MTSTKHKFIYSYQNKEELINYYEALRSLALDKSRISISENLGFSILLFRGMPTWIKACLSSELINFSQSIPSHLEKIESNTETQSLVFPSAIQEEAAMILTNSILSHQLH